MLNAAKPKSTRMYYRAPLFIVSCIRFDMVFMFLGILTFMSFSLALAPQFAYLFGYSIDYGPLKLLIDWFAFIFFCLVLAIFLIMQISLSIVQAVEGEDIPLSNKEQTATEAADETNTGSEMHGLSTITTEMCKMAVQGKKFNNTQDLVAYVTEKTNLKPELVEQIFAEAIITRELMLSENNHGFVH